MSTLSRLSDRCYRFYNRLYNRVYCAEWTADEVVELLNSLLDRTLSSEDWDYFISVKIADPELEGIRERMAEIWVVNSPYMLPGSMNPKDLNQKGVDEIKKLITSIKGKNSPASDTARSKSLPGRILAQVEEFLLVILSALFGTLQSVFLLFVILIIIILLPVFGLLSFLLSFMDKK